MADLKTRQIDSKKISQGDWIGLEYGTPIPGWDDLCLRVRGYGSPQYRLARAVKQKSLKPEDYEQGVIKPEVEDRLFAETLDEVILLEWKNLTDGDAVVEHNSARQSLLLLDPDNKPLRDAVDFAAIVVDVRKKEVEEKVEGN